MILQKTKFYRVVGIVLFVGFLMSGGANQAGATTATFAQDTTVSMDVGNMTIKSGSVVDSIITTATTITLSMSGTQTFTLESSGKKKLNNDKNVSFSCESSKSVLTINANSIASVVITPSSDECTFGGGGISGGGGGGGLVTMTPTPTPTPTVSPAVSPTPTPAPSVSKPTPAEKGFVSLQAVSLNDGDVISTAGSDDPDVYIVNPHGYKRLFLNPAIFGFYGHLGGFQAVKSTTSVTRDVFVTSGLFRNCETDDPKVYGVETTGEDSGVLHWVNTTGEQAVADDPDFFKKVFCINNNEFNWYPKGDDYTSVNQIPDYAR